MAQVMEWECGCATPYTAGWGQLVRGRSRRLGGESNRGLLDHAGVKDEGTGMHESGIRGIRGMTRDGPEEEESAEGRVHNKDLALDGKGRSQLRAFLSSELIICVSCLYFHLHFCT